MDGLGGNFPKNIRTLASGITSVPIPGIPHVTLRHVNRRCGCFLPEAVHAAERRNDFRRLS